MIRPEQVPDIAGGTVYDAAGEEVGQATDFAFDDEGRPLSVTVRERGGDRLERVVPLDGASADGTSIRLGVDRGSLGEAGPAGGGGGAGLVPDDFPLEAAAGQRGQGLGALPDAERPEVVRSEERLRASGVQVVEAFRARLVRSVETVTRTIEVQVRREVARLEVDPLPEARVVEGQLEPQEHVMVLREEQPVVTLRAVPYAYARLETELVRAEGVVRDEVRVERVGLDTDDAAGRDTPGTDGTPGRDTRGTDGTPGAGSTSGSDGP